MVLRAWICEVRAVIGDALRHVTAWKASAMASARELAKGEDSPAADMAEAERVQPAAVEMQAALKQAQVLALFDAFDERFDGAWDRIRTDRPTA